MKRTVRNRPDRFALFLASICACLALEARALDVIGPTGVNYTSISGNSAYDPTFTALNLFDQNMTGVALGSSISGSDFARSGVGDCYVAFQLDQVYTNVASIFYAQRSGANPAVDKIGVISIWASTTTPYTAADPGTPPNSVIPITISTGAQWNEYLMTNSVGGQYFLLKLSQTSVGGNPGGRELRLGATLGQAPVISTVPIGKTVYVGGTAHFDAVVSGTAPLTYTWTHGSATLSNGGEISGAGTANLTITNVTPADAGNYSLTVSNAYGTASASANLTTQAAPTNAAETAIISKHPLAFWQFNETTGSTSALDLVGSFNGFYGGSSILGLAGPQSPAFSGFAATNTAVQTTAFTIDSAVTLPPLNLSLTNSMSIVAWVYLDNSGGPQQPYTGIVFCRGAGTAAGLICSSDGTKLGYQWGGSRYFFDSGLILPANQWTMVAMVYTTNFTTLYCGSTNGIVLSAVDNFAQGGQSFAAPTEVGLDTDLGESARTFNGSIDDVAFFNRALTGSEINSIYAAGTGIVPSVQILSQTATNLTIYQGEPLSLAVQASGLNPSFQWFKQNAPIPGATNTAFNIASIKLSDAGNYYVIVSNQVNTATSAVITVTVPTYVVRPIDATGLLYSGISASSEYPDPNYAGTNMFDTDLTGIPVGTVLSGKDWADDGASAALGPAYLAFQMDQVYSVQALFYAQRAGNSGFPVDKITMLSIWANPTNPFAASDPGTTPDAVISVPEIDAAVLHRYILPATISGKYFLIKVEQNPNVANSNIGGNEFRLGAFVTPSTLALAKSPAGISLTWTGGTLQQADSLSGPWVPASGITSGVPFTFSVSKRFYRIQY
jgi:hypothetical protein